jgi:hypothetical protein
MTFQGFEVGRTYNRRRDIHGKYGGQMQGGICTPKNHPLVMAFTHLARACRSGCPKCPTKCPTHGTPSDVDILYYKNPNPSEIIQVPSSFW